MNENAEKEHHLDVAVLTTSGRWPESGFEQTAVNQKVRQVLREAARHLHLTGVDDWIATVNGTTLRVDESFRANGLTEGRIVIDFGPRQGGGGRA